MGVYDRDYYRDESLNLQPTWNNRSAVSTIIILNVAIYVANILLSSFEKVDQGTVNTFLMLVETDLGKPWLWWHTLSYAFTHDATNVMHILFNMLGLYFLGRAVEDKYGKSEFLRIYLICAVVCGLLWLLKANFIEHEKLRQLLGASGAVICIEMLFVLNFPKQIIYLFVFPVPAWVVGILIVLSTLLTKSENVAVEVHVIGILFAAAYFFGKWNFGFVSNFQSANRRWKRRWFGPKLKVVRDDLDSTAINEAEADRILEKIHQQGKDALTSKERKFMERYSRQVRERKQEF